MHTTAASMQLSDFADVRPLNEQSSLPLQIICRASASGSSGAGAFLKIWTEHRECLDQELHRYGALLFRGFDISDQETFQSLITQLKERLLDYVDGNSPRTKVGSGVYTSTEYPPEYFISMHNELSYSAQWPARLFFCCIVEPQQGGQTPLVDSRTLLSNLPHQLVEEFRQKGVKYMRNLHGGKGFGPSWQKTFETTKQEDVARYAQVAGMEIEWHSDNSVALSNTRPASARHPVTGEEVWFNQADQFHPSTHPEAIYKAMLSLYNGREDRLPQNATFGDGSPIPLEYLQIIRETTRRQLILFNWQRGDLLMVDNMLVAHGRMPFKGPRRILVSMTAQ